MPTLAYVLSLLAFVICDVISDQPAAASELIEAEMQVADGVVPGPVEYAVLLPDSYSAERDREFPLLLDLHGGGGDRGYLGQVRFVYDAMWAEGVPEMVVVTPSVTPRSFYMDYQDGSERWETFLVGPFIAHLRSTYHVRTDRAGTLLTGISMGGMGSLRMALKHPDTFAAVAAMEPGIAPVMQYRELRPKHRFWRSDRLMRTVYGDPIDETYWAANHPPAIAAARADTIRASGLAIYIECGDEDLFWLYEGTEFLHRVLWDGRIRHEYHLVRGADHVGRTVAVRKRETLQFLARVLEPPGPDPVADRVRRLFDPAKARLNERDHYSGD